MKTEQDTKTYGCLPMFVAGIVFWVAFAFALILLWEHLN